MKTKTIISLFLAALFLAFQACEKDPSIPQVDGEQGVPPGWEYDPAAYEVDLPQMLEQRLPDMPVPADNPLTEEGVRLGRMLFFDPILSGDNTQSCAGCHAPPGAFSDQGNALSTGIDGKTGTRNAMPLFNLAWQDNFNWSGSASSLEEQAFEPVRNPVEMHETWPHAVDELRDHPEYPRLFYEAFGVEELDSTHVTKALAQFERTLISGNSKFDRYLMGQTALTGSELNGFNIFMAEDKGDCFHCHGDPQNPLWTDNAFHNNGLDASFSDPGLMEVTGNANHEGLFKTPSLRNLAFTAPYMHDGRFQTLDEVIDHYSEGLTHSPTIDPLMKAVDQGGVHLSPSEKEDLKAFLLSLSDSSFINNPEYQKPPLP